MTIDGTVNKVGILLLLVLVPAAWMCNQVLTAWEPSQAHGHRPCWAASAASIFALITVFKKTWAPVTAPIYAVLEGLFLGGISARFHQRSPACPCRRWR